jgi:hypothetical protein
MRATNTIRMLFACALLCTFCYADGIKVDMAKKGLPINYNSDPWGTYLSIGSTGLFTINGLELAGQGPTVNGGTYSFGGGWHSRRPSSRRFRIGLEMTIRGNVTGVTSTLVKESHS